MSKYTVNRNILIVRNKHFYIDFVFELNCVFYFFKQSTYKKIYCGNIIYSNAPMDRKTFCCNTIYKLTQTGIRVTL